MAGHSPLAALLFTRDRRFLAKNYPALKGAAEFCADWLVDDGKGRLVTAAGCSPEIHFHYRGKTAGISTGPTMDLGIMRDLFAAAIRASELLGQDPEFRAALKGKLDPLL